MLSSSETRDIAYQRWQCGLEDHGQIMSTDPVVVFRGAVFNGK
jgi:hypothetical protein